MDHPLIPLPPRGSSARTRRASWPAPALVLCLALRFLSPASGAALLEESFQIVPGWNSIHLAVEPVDGDPHTVLSGIDWESIWTWLPAAGEPRGGRWLVAHREAPPFLGTLESATGTSALFRLAGPNSYLLFARSGGTLRITGEVRADRQALTGGAFQLFSPRIDAANPPSLAAYFSRSGVVEHKGDVFELRGSTYRRVADGDSLRPSTAYWILPDQNIPRPGPVRVLAGLGGLRFDARATVQELVLDVGSGPETLGGPSLRQLRLRVIPSVGDSSGTEWLEVQGPDGSFSSIDGDTTIDVAAEASIARVAFRAWNETIASTDARDRALVVEITSPESKVLVSAELALPQLPGLWLGDALLTEVDRPAASGGGFAPAPETQIALILEIPEAGPARLLPCASVDSVRDGRTVSVRFGSALFHDEVVLTGSIADDGQSGVLSGSTSLEEDHPLNPYRHRYNPEHATGFAVTRAFKLSVGADGPAPAPSNPLAAVGLIRGVYEETITGLTQDPIRVRGAFRLRRLTGGSVSPCSSRGQ